MANPRWALDVRKPRMKLPIRGRIFQVKLPARARRAEITTRAPIIGLAEVNVGYGCVEPLKIPSVEGPFQRVQRGETEEPKPDASIPHQGRKTLASARAPARSEIMLILGKLAAPGLDIAGTRLHRTWI